MTDPKDYYPWPPIKSTAPYSFGELVDLVHTPEGREDLEFELTTGLKEVLLANPWLRKHRPIHMPGLPADTEIDPNAKEILRIYNFLRDDRPYISHPSLSIYYRAYRKALSVLRFERTVLEWHND